ncbi:MAG: SpoIIE family protein phosphatase [Calditrichaceae bacterium]|jgi:serine phosphatase RsbU (regulator of sigma subunit)
MFKNSVKFLYLVFIFLIYSNVLAQFTDTVYVQPDSIEKNSLRLDMAWRFHSGDSAVWASPKFDDSNWDTVNTRLELSDSLLDFWTGIGWFRKYIKIDSSLRNKTLGLIFSQEGASEIYLNGVLVQKFGKVDSTIEDEEVYDPYGAPVILRLDTSLVYTLAVRYSNARSVKNFKWYKKWNNMAGFISRIGPMFKTIRSRIMNESLNMVINIGIACVFISLSLLYLLLFIFYARRRENLYYFLFTLFIALAFASSMIPRFFADNYFVRIFWSIISGISIVCIFWSYLGFLYSIFYEKVQKQFYIATGLVIILIASMFLYLPDTILQIILLGFIMISTLEGLRIIIVAIRKNKLHAWVIGTGVIIFVVFILSLFIIGFLRLNIDISYLLSGFMIGLLCIPISMSIYLAKNIATTNENLTKQLAMVKELSEKELEHEKRNAELKLKNEQEKAAALEATLRAETAEAQSRAMQAEHDRKTKELEEARQLQLSMLPKELPKLPNLDIAVYMQTATEVGGDYYDFHVDEDGTLTIVVGDATGHGMKAGTVVTASKSLFNSHAQNPDILFTFKEITRSLKMMDLHLLSMCMTLMKIKNNKVQLSAAGMPPVLLYRQTTGKVEEMLLKGMPLGTFQEYEYQLQETTIQPGDTILFMSDGLPELFNDSKEMFGYEKIHDLFKSSGHLPVDKIIDTLKNAGSDWTNGADPQDDVTFVAVKMK